jgi:hypothetical protein
MPQVLSVMTPSTNRLALDPARFTASAATIRSSPALALMICGDSGNDTVVLKAGNTGVVSGFTGNDSIYAAGDIGSMTLYGYLGADTIDAWQSYQSQTIFCGDGTDDTDSKDGSDSLSPETARISSTVKGATTRSTATWAMTQ